MKKGGGPGWGVPDQRAVFLKSLLVGSAQEEDNEDDEELDDEEDEEEGDLARGIQIDGGIRKMGGVQIDEAILVGGVQVASEPPAKRKGPAAAQEAPVSKRCV